MSNYIAHMIPEYLGHTLNWVYTQIQHVKGYTPYVITRRTLNLDAYPLERIYTSQHTETLPTQTPWGERIVRRLGFLPWVDFRCFSRVLSQYPPIFLHAHFGWDGFFALGLKKKHNLPLVTRFYGYDVGILPRIPLWKKRYRRLFAEGDLFIVEGTNMKRILTNMGCPVEKIAIHHLGVELDKISYCPRIANPEKLRILIAGTFKEKKGLEYALRAVADVRNRLTGMDVETTVIGDGKLKDHLYGVAAQVGLSDRIHWTGYQPHEFFIEQLYEADVFLSPSVTAADGDTEGGAPVSLIEAAAIDGAGPWRRFWSIQFPLLSPTTFFLLVINVVYAFFDTFAIVDATTHGGPGQSTNILVYKVYHDGFKNLDLGGSAAQSVILMAIVIMLTVVQFRYVEKKVNY